MLIIMLLTNGRKKNTSVFESPQVIAAFLSSCGNSVSECREAH